MPVTDELTSATAALNGQSGRCELMTVPDSADLLSVSPKTLWAWISAGRIGVVRLGRCVRIKNSEIQRLIEEGSTPAREIRRSA
jgi:excisionase family DNA binding protein